MDETYRRALRAWEAAPQDQDLVANLYTQALRAGALLPERLDPRSAFVAHVERVQATYALLDGGGYGHWAAGRFIDHEPPYSDLAGLQALLTSLSEGEADQGQVPYPCLGVNEVTELDEIPCGHNTSWGGPGGCPEPIAQGFERFAESTAALTATFPGLRVFGINADYPDDGQVYWEQSYLLWLPYYPGSFLCVMQYVW